MFQSVFMKLSLLHASDGTVLPEGIVAAAMTWHLPA